MTAMTTAQDESELRTAARSYLEAKIAPEVSSWERRRQFPWNALAGLYDLGYVRGVVPEAHGGLETTHLQQAVLMEEAGRCWGSLRTTVNVQSMVARLMSLAANDEQRDRFLTPMMAGQRFGWFGMTEPDAGSDAAQCAQLPAAAAKAG